MRIVALVVIALASTTPTRADDRRKPPEGSPVASDKPWTRGVSAERRVEAQSLLDRGNAAFLQNRHKEALALYEQALAVWDHPAIRFNAVRALLALDKSILAQEYLERALAYGAEPLEDAVYREALNYQRLLAQTIGVLVVRCTQRGVQVRIDGGQSFTCPHEEHRKLAPGKHAVSATGARLQPAIIDAVVSPGTQELVTVELQPANAVITRTRWAPWKVWTVVGAGAAIAGVGFGFRIDAVRRSDELEGIVRSRCQAACTPDQFGIGALEARIDRDNLVWGTGLAVGVGAIGIGLALVILNRPQVVEQGAVSVSVGQDFRGAVYSRAF